MLLPRFANVMSVLELPGPVLLHLQILFRAKMGSSQLLLQLSQPLMKSPVI
jgi:hypothetical protein